MAASPQSCGAASWASASASLSTADLHAGQSRRLAPRRCEPRHKAAFRRRRRQSGGATACSPRTGQRIVAISTNGGALCAPGAWLEPTLARSELIGNLGRCLVTIGRSSRRSAASLVDCPGSFDKWRPVDRSWLGGSDPYHLAAFYCGDHFPWPHGSQKSPVYCHAGAARPALQAPSSTAALNLQLHVSTRRCSISCTHVLLHQVLAVR